MFDDAAAGPAKPVPGAKRGGTVSGLNDDSLQVLDPQRDYGADTMSLSSALLFRSLTGYVQDGMSLRLVGDLATNTGVPSQNGSVWDYTLRDNVLFEDGTPILADDIAYGIARSFDRKLDGGPNYIQNWLYDTKGVGFRDKWQPSPGKLPDGLAVIDHKRLRLTFASPHPEFPMVAALGTTTPVPRAKDTGKNYGNAPVSSGPYKIGPGRSAHHLELVRNDKWRPASDPIRHDYPDKFLFEDGLTEADASLRVLAAQGAHQTAFTWNNVDPAVLDEARRGARDRTLRAPSPRMKYLAINTRNVPDLAVRQAIVAAIDRTAALETFGGDSYGTETTTLQSSVMPGYLRHTALGVGPHGDPAKARKLLAGKKVRPLTYIYRDVPAAPRERKLAEAVKKALGAVGIRVILYKYTEGELGLLDEIGKKDNRYDLYSFVWTPDIPDSAGLFGLWNRREITDRDNKNVSYLQDPLVTGQIETLNAEPDRNKAAAGYAALDEQIITRDAPAVPLFERTRNTLYGPKLRGLYINRTFGAVSLVNVYVL
jgi:peptide/nickel transport system substrate-binding protein